MTERCSIIILCVLGFLTVLFFVIGGAGPSILQALLDKKIEDDLPLQEDDHEKWGSFPGEIGIVVVRDYIVNNFTNSEDVIFRNAKPVFQESPLYKYQELLDFTDREYKDDDNIVRFNYWQRFIHFKGHRTTGEEPVQFMNIGPLSVWSKLKQNPPPKTALSILSNLILTSDKTLINNALGQIIGITQLGSFNQDTIKNVINSFNIDGITEKQIDLIATDPVKGWTDKGISEWINTVFDAQSGDPLPQLKPGLSSLKLQDYFGLNLLQMTQIQTNLYNICIQVYDQAFANGFCQSPLLSNTQCTNKDFTAAQWISTLLTQGQSILDNGVIELNLYYSNIFSNTTNPYFVSADAVFNINFSLDWAQQVMKYLDTPDNDFIKEPQALLNIGNLNLLFQQGEQFDKSNQVYNNSPFIQRIQQQFQLQSLEHTYVFWNYIKYITNEIGLQSSLGGSAESSAIGLFASSGIQRSFEGLESFLLPTLTAAMMQGALQSSTCNDIFQGTGLSSDEIDQLCTQLNSNNEPLDIQAITQINIKCQTDTNEPYITICSPPSLYGATLQGVSQRISQHYNCQGLSFKCTNYEIASKQWVEGEITKNPITELQTVLPPSDSISTWFPQVFPKPIEYYAISLKLQDTFLDQNLFSPTPEQLRLWLSLQKLYSQQLVGLTFIFSKNPQLQPLIPLQLFTTNTQQLLTFFRFITLEVSFGGFIIERKLNDFLFRYEDPFLKTINQRNPQEGGDPSISFLSRLSAQNQTYEERVDHPMEWYTGKHNKNMIKKIKEVEGQTYVARKIQIFNGYEVIKTTINPWEEEIPLIGTDGTQVEVDQHRGDTTEAFVFPLFFGTELKQTRETEHNDLKCFRYEVDELTLANENVNPKNKGMFFFGPSGQLNMTKARQGPFFISQPHFYLADDVLLDNVTIINEDGNIQGPTKYDATFIEAEEHSGVGIQVSLKQQINVELQPDLLFPIQFNRYLPVYTVARSYNWTESQVDEEFSSLIKLLDAKTYVYAFGFSLAGIFLIIFVIYLHKYINRDKNKSKQYTTKSSGIIAVSTQPSGKLLSEPSGKMVIKEEQVKVIEES